jgi:hypothetical protein
MTTNGRRLQVSRVFLHALEDKSRRNLGYRYDRRCSTALSETGPASPLDLQHEVDQREE